MRPPTTQSGSASRRAPRDLPVQFQELGRAPLNQLVEPLANQIAQLPPASGAVGVRSVGGKASVVD